MEKDTQIKFNELLIGLKNDQGSLKKLDDFYKRQASNNDNELEIQYLMHKSSILFCMEKYRDALNISYDLLGKIEKTHNPYPLIVLMVIQCEIKTGNQKKAKKLIYDQLKQKKSMNPFQKLSIMKLLVDIKLPLDGLKLYDNQIKELVTFFGYKINPHDLLKDVVEKLYDQNKISNKNFSLMLLSINTIENPERKKTIDDYIETEILEYYRNMARNHY